MEDLKNHSSITICSQRQRMLTSSGVGKVLLPRSSITVIPGADFNSSRASSCEEERGHTLHTLLCWVRSHAGDIRTSKVKSMRYTAWRPELHAQANG